VGRSHMSTWCVTSPLSRASPAVFTKPKPAGCSPSHNCAHSPATAR
jgi:hypothetical protein